MDPRFLKGDDVSRFDVATIGEGQLRYSVPVGNRLEDVTQLDVHASIHSLH
jgi:hypothetical protein